MKPYVLYAGLSKANPAWKPACVLIRWAEATKTLNPLSWLRLFPASHVFTVFPSHAFRPFYLVNEAAGTMVRWVSEPNFKKHSEITHLYKFTIPSGAFFRIKLYGELAAGLPYALAENIGIIVVRLARALGIRIKNPFGTGYRAQKCSELVMRSVMKEFLHYAFGPDFEVKHLAVALKRDQGYTLPVDVDVLGVADLYEIFEWLAEGGYVERMPVTHAMHIAS